MRAPILLLAIALSPAAVRAEATRVLVMPLRASAEARATADDLSRAVVEGASAQPGHAATLAASSAECDEPRCVAEQSAAAQSPLHPIHMKRTNLVLDEKLLELATRLSGEKTYSRAVQRALEEFVRRVQARQILDLAGSGLWEGSLGAMRQDAPSPRRKGRR